jgi:hypothetical protein
MLANCGVTDFRPDIAHFGTNRGTSGFNPVWTACDMIMNRNRIGSSRPGTRCDLLHFDADDRFQFGALACESVLQLACGTGVSMPATQKHQIPTKRWPTDLATVEPEADTWKVNIINGNSKMILG